MFCFFILFTVSVYLSCQAAITTTLVGILYIIYPNMCSKYMYIYFIFYMLQLNQTRKDNIRNRDGSGVYF